MIRFSVIIAAKNEERGILNTLRALEQQNYPAEGFEVIVVDDNSTDSTYRIICSYAKDKPQFKIVKAGRKPFPAKKGTLSVGISYSENPYIAITDADCIPEPGWLKALAEKFEQGADMVFGNAPFIHTGSLMNKIASFENLRSFFLVFFAAKNGFPYSAAARNFAYRKAAFYAIGGYSNTLDTLSGDDDLLMREAIKKGLNIKPLLKDNSFVWSHSKENLKDYLKQKARHTSTANHYLYSRQAALFTWHTLNLVFLFAPLLSFISGLFLLPFLGKMTFDAILVISQQRKFGYSFNLREIIMLQVLYELFLIINYTGSLLRKDTRWN